jgi:hypothetical protein
MIRVTMIFTINTLIFPFHTITIGCNFAPLLIKNNNLLKFIKK